MLILNTRAPSIMIRSFLGSLAPSATSLCLHLPEPRNAINTARGTAPILPAFNKSSTARLPAPGSHSESSTVSPRILGLFGLRNTEKIVGPSALWYVMSRDFSSFGPTKADQPAPPMMRLCEPHGSAIKVLEPEFHKAGLIKTYEGEFSAIFSLGTYQFIYIAPPDNSFRIRLYFRDENGFLHILDKLMKRFEPIAFAKHWSDLDVILKKYGLNAKDTPEAKREEGVRLLSMLRCRYAISFLAANKETLADMSPIF